MKIKRYAAIIVSVITALLLVSQWIAAVSARPGEIQPETINVWDQDLIHVRINEVMPNPTDEEFEFVELSVLSTGSVLYLPLITNGSANGRASGSESDGVGTNAASFVSGINLVGWQVSDEDGNIYTIPEALPEVPAGAFVLILFDGLGEGADDYDFSDGAAVLHSQPGLVDVFEDEGDQVSLYEGDEHNPETLRDFMAYGALAGEDGATAYEAGLWFDYWSITMENSSGLITREHPKPPGDSLGILPGIQIGGGLPDDWFIYQGGDVSPGERNPQPGIYWSTASNGAMMSTDGFALGWGFVPEAEYHFQLDDDQYFISPLMEIVLDQPYYAPETAPAPGSYFWRVRAIGFDGSPGAWSEPFAVGVRAGEDQENAPSEVNQTIIPNLTWLRQKKDTRLLCVDGDARGIIDNDPAIQENAWDTVHPNAILTHGWSSCARASVAMIARVYGGNISQDRLSYYEFETSGNPTDADVGNPTHDLGHNLGTLGGGSDGGPLMDLIEWALNVSSTKVDFEIHGCGLNPQGSTDHPTFTKIQSWINAGRPIIKGAIHCHHVVDNPATSINEACACGSHGTVIGGWRVLADGTQQIRQYDPWSGVSWVDYNDDSSTPANETFYIDWAYVPPASAPNVRSDEPSIWTDSDGDGIMDFDEFNRFSSQASNPDSDADWVDDKSDLAEVYFNSIGLYQPKASGPDMDSDGKDKESDPDNDGGGTVDGCEDYDYDGVKDGSETSNFNSSDDTTCVPAFEIRYPTTQVTAEVGNKASPNKLMIRVLASIPPAAGTLTLTASDFKVEVQDEAATILVPPYRVGDEYWIIIQPPVKTTAAGLYNLWVQLQSGLPDLEINAIHYSNTNRAPVDEVLVIDNSGSMAQYSKMVSTKNAARAFIDRWLTHDMVGLVAFSTTVSIPYPLTEVTSTVTLTNAKTAINNMPNTPNPYWYTAIGSGLLNAKSELAASTGGHPQSIILLSDGMENENPKWSDPSSGVQAAFKNCAIKVHTVAIGPTNASHRALLKDISKKACNGDGMAWHTSGGGTSPTKPESTSSLTADFPGDLGNRLADIYLSIAELDSGHQRLWEATGFVGLDLMATHYVTVPVGLPEAIWTLNWDIGDAVLDLYDPNGTPISAGDPGVTRISDSTHDQFRILNPQEGIWQADIRNTGGEDFTEYLAVLSGLSDPQMWLLFGLPPEERVVGVRLPIHAALADFQGIPGAEVELTIKAPGAGLDASYTLFDDGGHEDQDADDGLYGNPAYYDIEMPGSYSIKAVAKGMDNTGDPYELYLTRSFYVKPSLAYIFNPENPQDGEAAEIYAGLLANNGFNVATIPVGEVGTGVDLGSFDLVMIGPGTGEMDLWGTEEARDHINETGLPVIGLGEGGYAFFGQLGLDIGYDNGAHGSHTTVHVEDTSSSVWSDPYPIDVPGSHEVDLFLDPISLVEIFAETLPDDATAIASDIIDPSYYPIIQQAGRFVLWGFNGHPEQMTTTGQEVFVNLVWYME